MAEKPFLVDEEQDEENSPPPPTTTASERSTHPLVLMTSCPFETRLQIFFKDAYKNNLFEDLKILLYKYFDKIIDVCSIS